MIPEFEANKEMRFILIAPNSKRPIENDWQETANYDYTTIQQKLAGSQNNYGTACGYANICVIDADSKGKNFPEMIEKMRTLAPKTFTVQTKSKGFHFYFKLTNPEKAKPITLKDGNGEIRWKGQQVVAPQSKIDGNEYLTSSGIPIAETRFENLQTILSSFLPEEKIPNNLDGNGMEKIEITIQEIANLSGLKNHGSEYFGAHPVHGSENGMNFWVNPSKNLWHCFRHNTGGDALQLFAMQEGLLQCEQCGKGALKGELFKKTLELLEQKTGKSFKKKISVRPQLQTLNKENDLPSILMPCENRTISDFAEDASEILKTTEALFYRIDAKEIVEIGKIKIHKTSEEVYTGFLEMKPERFVTVIERYFNPCITFWNKYTQEQEFQTKSISPQLAKTVLASHILQQALPQISRIFTVPLPILYENTITFPKKGYDKRFSSWLPCNAPEINPTLSLEAAKTIIDHAFKEFCFKTEQDKHNAIAALLTPYLRGIFTNFNVRVPVWFYLANRERAGKDYLAGITGIVYEGNNIEDAPISNSEHANSNNNEELRKKLLAAMIYGRKRLHFSNNKGHINNSTFEQIATSEKYADRLLGRNEILTFDNELDFSLSGNVGVSFTADFANRCRFIRLFLDIENANERQFETPNLHEWVKNNRNNILSALFAFVRHWQANGSKKGSLPFASFPEWASVCGGIMEAAGYKNPCEPDQEIELVGGDTETNEMKGLFETCFEKCPNEFLSKPDIRRLCEDNGVFSFMDFDSKKDLMSFGKKISKFTGRILSGIKMDIENANAKSQRQRFRFTKKEDEIAVTIHDYNKK